MMRARNMLQPVIVAALGAFFLLFLIYPLSYAVTNSIFVDGKFTLAFFGLITSSVRQWEIVLNSFNLAIGTTALVSLIAIPLAVFMIRYEFRAKRVVASLLLVPLLLPSFIGALGFRQIAGRFGALNLLLMQIGIIDTPIDWLGEAKPVGIVIMQSLHLFPIMYLNIAAAFGGMNVTLEEAASVVGANRLSILRRITCPLLFPAWFSGAALVFVASFTDLGTPVLFDYRAVIPVQIFNLLADINQNPMGYALVVFLAFISVAIFLIARPRSTFGALDMMARGMKRRTVVKLSGIKAIIYLSGLGLLFLCAFLPHIGVLGMALSDEWFMSITPQKFTFQHFIEIFRHPLTLVSLRNSFGLSIASMVMDLILGFAIAFFLVRTRISGKWVLELISILPLAVPGIVFAFGYVGAFSGTILDNRVNPIPLLIIAYSVRRLPYMIRSASTGLMQASAALEDAARTVGASQLVVWRRITLPLMATHLIAGSVLCFAFAMLEVSDSLVLAMEEQFFPVSKAVYNLVGRPDGVELACALSVLVVGFVLICLWGGARLLKRDLADFVRI